MSAYERKFHCGVKDDDKSGIEEIDFVPAGSQGPIGLK